MHALANHLFAVFFRLGGLGQFTLGILDSSFLFMPLGNDLLMIAQTSHRRELMLYYAAMATVGSVLGCLLVDVILRKGGEEGLERHVSRKRLEYVKRKVKKNAGWALAVASLAPPPFPFTPFIMAAAALQYPRKNMVAVIAATRMVRFTAEGLLALQFGRRIVQLAKQPAVEWAIIGLIVLCIAGSIVSVLGWVRRSRKVESRQLPATQ